MKPPRPAVLPALHSLRSLRPGPAPRSGSRGPRHSERAQTRPMGLQRRMRTLAYEITVAEARARERLANGLHDTLGQLLAVAQLRVAELGALVQGEEARTRLKELRAVLAEASRETRAATFELHSPVLQQLGLDAAIRGLAERLSHEYRLQLRVDGSLEGLTASLAEQAVVLRIVRELLLNVHKHARASSVLVRMAFVGQRLWVSVVDNGRGLPVRRPLRRASAQPHEVAWGLASAEAQMRAIGGTLELHSPPHRGTTATLTLPCKPWRRITEAGAAR